MTTTSTRPLITEKAARRAVRIAREGLSLPSDEALVEQAVRHLSQHQPPLETRLVFASSVKLRYRRDRGWYVDCSTEDQGEWKARLELINASLRHCSPYPIGARVRNHGQQWYEAIDKGTAFLIDVVPQHDGTYEYKVRKDKPYISDELESWWASYSTYRALDV